MNRLWKFLLAVAVFLVLLGSAFIFVLNRDTCPDPQWQRISIPIGDSSGASVTLHCYDDPFMGVSVSGDSIEREIPGRPDSPPRWSVGLVSDGLVPSMNVSKDQFIRAYDIIENFNCNAPKCNLPPYAGTYLGLFKKTEKGPAVLQDRYFVGNVQYIKSLSNHSDDTFTITYMIDDVMRSFTVTVRDDRFVVISEGVKN